MIEKDLVANVNQNLTTLLERAKNSKADPILIELIHQMKRVTDLDGARDLPENVADFSTLNPENVNRVTAKVHQMADHPGFPDGRTKAERCADGQHGNIDPFGLCRDCGKCTHSQVRNGACVRCDEPIED